MATIARKNYPISLSTGVLFSPILSMVWGVKWRGCDRAPLTKKPLF